MKKIKISKTVTTVNFVVRGSFKDLSGLKKFLREEKYLHMKLGKITVVNSKKIDFKMNITCPEVMGGVTKITIERFIKE